VDRKKYFTVVWPKLDKPKKKRDCGFWRCPQKTPRKLETISWPDFLNHFTKFKCRDPLYRGGLDVIRQEAWSFHRTISGVLLYWRLEEPKGPKGSDFCGVWGKRMFLGK
jgi:hypothetical protein